MENDILNLVPNEYIVYKREEADVLYKEEEIELFITNLNIIIVNETRVLFKKPVIDIIKLPIEDIQMIDNIPQVTVELHEYDYWNIVVLFNNGIKRFGIYYGSNRNKNATKNEANLIAEKISQLRLTGTIILKKSKPLIEEQKESTVTNVKNTIKESFFGKKIASGANYIKQAVKPKNKEQVEIIEESQTIIDVEVKPSEKEFNFCRGCGKKKSKTDKFCPACGLRQDS